MGAGTEFPSPLPLPSILPSITPSCQTSTHPPKDIYQTPLPPSPCSYPPPPNDRHQAPAGASQTPSRPPSAPVSLSLAYDEQPSESGPLSADESHLINWPHCASPTALVPSPRARGGGGHPIGRPGRPRATGGRPGATGGDCVALQGLSTMDWDALSRRLRGDDPQCRRRSGCPARRSPVRQWPESHRGEKNGSAPWFNRIRDADPTDSVKWLCIVSSLWAPAGLHMPRGRDFAWLILMRGLSLLQLRSAGISCEPGFDRNLMLSYDLV